MDSEKILGTIGATAFVINVSRAKRVDISQDIYAKYWITPESLALWDELAREVYTYDDLSSSLRNRFYLENLKKFSAENKGGKICINLGAGFSCYPFLVEDDSCEWVEIDYPHVLEFKKMKLAQWQQQGLFPNRRIQFFAADLNDSNDLERVAAAFANWCINKASYVIIEGLTYYLKPELLQKLFSIFSQQQTFGSKIAFEYWPAKESQNTVFVKLQQYLTHRFGMKNQTYNLMSIEDIQAIPGYTVLAHTPIAEVESKYANSQVFNNPDKCLPIHFVVLNKEA